MHQGTNNIILYGLISIIWGSTWYAIHLQLGTVPPMWSIVYRFGFAAVILLLYCVLTRMNLRFSKRQHLLISLQGLLLFSVNYILYYFASGYLVSGVIALIFALIVLMNIIHCRLFFKTPITPNVLFATAMGFIGLVLVFWSQSGQWLEQSEHRSGLTGIFIGIGLATIGTVIASLGNIMAVYNKQQGIPIVACNAFGILYGTLFTLIFTLVSGQPIAFDTSWNYLLSLIYLSVVGTIIAFGAYVVLINRIGADRGGYVFVSTPIVALLLSTFYEEFQWSILSMIGVVTVMAGNLLVLRRKKELSPSPSFSVDLK